MERSCELCSKPARMFCESDEARLCWECDEKVHSANFLVAKHSRCLLCHVCRSPTPWKASGTKLNPTISVCEGCFEDGNNARSIPVGVSSGKVTTMTRRRPRLPSEEYGDFDRGSSAGGSDDGDEDDEEEEEEEEECFSDEEDREIVEEEDGENQVVPWTACPSGQSPSVSSAPPMTSSSSSSEELGKFSTRNNVLKRSRDDHIQEDYSDDEDDACCSSQLESNLATSFRASKMARAENNPGGLRRRMQLVGSLINLQETTADGYRPA